MIPYQQLFTPQEIEQALKSGYTEQMLQDQANEEEMKMQLENSTRQIQQMNQMPYGASGSMFASGQDNLFKVYLETDKMLERAEHILRGDRLTYINGSEIWVRTEKPEEMIFNEYGTNRILKVLSFYLNTNTVLSVYKDDKIINDKVYDFGVELNNLVYCNYKEFGMDTEEKRKMYPMIIRELVDIVHSAYLRAINGFTAKIVKTVWSINQSESTMEQSEKKKRSALNPMRLIKGEYV